MFDGLLCFSCVVKSCLVTVLSGTYIHVYEAHIGKVLQFISLIVACDNYPDMYMRTLIEIVLPVV